MNVQKHFRSVKLFFLQLMEESRFCHQYMLFVLIH